jgi:predicted aspartyl protease
MNRLALVAAGFVVALAFGSSTGAAQNLPQDRKEPRAQFGLGSTYFRQGHYAEAVKWWHLSAAQGWVPAQYALAESFMKGRGVPQDDAAAVSWYRSAADQGLPSAQYKLGLAYLSGVGVPKDAVTSYVWLSLAVAGGAGMRADERERAMRFRRSLESILDPLEVARGRQLVGDWRPTWDSRPNLPARLPASIPAAAVPAGTVIPFTSGQPIYVDARVNGRTPARLVLDTGADSTVIAPDVLNAADAAVTGHTTLLGVTGQASVGIHHVASLEVGNVKVGPLKVIAHDAAHRAADGLLGRDFLERFTVTIDSAGGRVTLTPRQAASAEP